MKLYDFTLSGHAHRARLMASLLGLSPELVQVDLANGQHKSEEYLILNPFGQVPVLDDEGLIIFDSNAILIYLASRYDNDHTWYPDEPEQKAKINMWLSKAANEMQHGIAAARLVTLFAAPYDHASVKQKAHALLAIMDSYLQQRSWFVGEAPTIADVALYSYTAHVPEGGVSLAAYKNVQRWLRNVEALPGFVGMPHTDTPAKQEL